MLELFDLLFPTVCIGCRTYGVLLCQQCKMHLLEKRVEQICIGCQKKNSFGWTCSDCLKRNPYLPERLLCATDYHLELSAKMVSTLKYVGVKNLSVPYAELLIEFLYNKLSSSALPKIKQEFSVCYVPMHKNKQVSRGFNQSELIADYFARKLDVPFLHLLQKIKKTKPQMGLNMAQRIINVVGAFEATECNNKNLILIDDVITTGSTLIQCSKALKQAGAKNVWCLVFAKD